MIRVATVVALVLLAQAVNDGQSRRVAPGSSGMHVDRHIDAHIAPREGTPATNAGERPPRDAPPEPASGTVAPPAETSPPPIQLHRDPLYRGRR
jgi:hypothetical protein